MGSLPLPKNLSPSAIGTIKQCPLRFKFSKLDKIPEPANESQLMGSFVHDVLAVLFSYPQKERTLAKAKEVAKNLWDTKWAEKCEGVVSDVTHPMFRWNVWWCVENLFKLENPAELSPTGIEHWVRGKIGEVPMVGIVDRWDSSSGTLTITDYKTGKIPTKAEYSDEKGFQLSVYGHMLEQETGLPVGLMELLYLKDAKRVTYVFDEKARQAMLEEVKSAWKEVKKMCGSGEFPARPSVLCGWCSYKGTICPAFPKNGTQVEEHEDGSLTIRYRDG